MRPLHFSGAWRRPRDTGFAMLDVLFALALGTTTVALALPGTRDVTDELRTRTAARYLAARLSAARLEAVARSTCIGLRFTPSTVDYDFVSYADGNANGIRSADIASGIDTPLGVAEALRDKFPGVQFELMNGYPDADGQPGTGADGVRVGSARIATMSPDGTATGGTLYLHGRQSQFAVRILGTTGRVRVLRYERGTGTWRAQ
jgi:hypothetical protein